jgi:hypothetical protein
MLTGIGVAGTRGIVTAVSYAVSLHAHSVGTPQGPRMSNSLSEISSLCPPPATSARAWGAKVRRFVTGFNATQSAVTGSPVA